MDKSIKSYQDLLKEKQALKHRIALHKADIKYNIESVKESIKPAKSAVGFVGKLTGKKSGNPVLAMVTKLATAFVLGKIIKKRKGGIIRKIAALILANFITLTIRPLVVSVNQFLLNKLKRTTPAPLPAETTLKAKQPY